MIIIAQINYPTDSDKEMALRSSAKPQMSPFMKIKGQYATNWIDWMALEIQVWSPDST